MYFKVFYIIICLGTAYILHRLPIKGIFILHMLHALLYEQLEVSRESG